MSGVPIGFDYSLETEQRQKGKKLKLHMRDVDDPSRTYCGRVCDVVQERLEDGVVEVWSNGSHMVATTDRYEDVQCAKCLTWA